MTQKSLAFYQKFFPIALLSGATFLFFGNRATAETLRTNNFIVTTTSRCEEGYVTCNNVIYNGTDVRTGASIQLRGKTMHTSGVHGTPGRFLGYEFRNGNYRYVVLEEGLLQVYKNGRLLIQEPGKWIN
ncbi:hypothetical protein [Gloeothece verrucosa]|uniref:MORN repeat-containing protein n=1 Tax=Gloeothece verrucosa (strain PCC 7822) TaxID=497965 RepID=E0UL28_GLOV7|nr:hypothetical protein [Gloeothece verrucosa]ADN17658.1 conserved hypothetical protein [Gloeothece verrucosa PCC 7822]